MVILLLNKLGSELAYSVVLFLVLFLKQVSGNLLLYLPMSCLYQELPGKYTLYSMMSEMPILDLFSSRVSSRITEWTWIQFPYFEVTSSNHAEGYHSHMYSQKGAMPIDASDNQFFVCYGDPKWINVQARPFHLCPSMGVDRAVQVTCPQT